MLFDDADLVIGRCEFGSPHTLSPFRLQGISRCTVSLANALKISGSPCRLVTYKSSIPQALEEAEMDDLEKAFEEVLRCGGEIRQYLDKEELFAPDTHPSFSDGNKSLG